MKKAIFLIALLATGCATARVESVNPGSSGVITYSPAGAGKGKEKAMILAKENCGNKPVKVTSEGYTVVGTHTSGSESSDSRRKRGYKSKSTSSTTTQVKEWRMKYKCSGK